jgi:hypothetical protein
VPRAAVIWLRKRRGINRVDSYDDSLREGLEMAGISVMFLLKRFEMEKNERKCSTAHSVEIMCAVETAV